MWVWMSEDRPIFLLVLLAQLVFLSLHFFFLNRYKTVHVRWQVSRPSSAQRDLSRKSVANKLTSSLFSG